MGKFFTLITDSGKDHFIVGRLKGLLYGGVEDARVVDITHEIDHFNMVDAAFQLETSFRYFPRGSIHLVSVNTYYDDPSIWIAFEKEGHFFIGPNNGMFSLLFPLEEGEVFEIGNSQSNGKWPGEVLCDAAVRLANEGGLEEYSPCTDIEQRINLQPVVGEKEIRGTVVYIDEFENVMTNITHEVYEKVRKGRQFALYFKRFDPITHLSHHYAEEEIGDTLCRFNSLGYLEIAIHLGKAASALGLKMNDTVQIEFY